MNDPEYIYDPEDWEYTLPFVDRDIYKDDAEFPPGELKTFKTLLTGPDRFLACVVLSLDDEGDPDETEYRWFDTKEEAQAALSDSYRGKSDAD